MTWPHPRRHLKHQLHDGKERARGTRHDYSPRSSLTPPHGDREYRPEQQSPSPRRKERSLSRSRSYSPR